MQEYRRTDVITVHNLNKDINESRFTPLRSFPSRYRTNCVNREEGDSLEDSRLFTSDRSAILWRIDRTRGSTEGKSILETRYRFEVEIAG